MTGFTATECQALWRHFEQAFETYRGTRTMDGQPRTSRRYRSSVSCPLPTIAAQLRFILRSVKPHPIQALQGQLLGMSPSKAHKWMHRVPAVVNQA